MGEPTASNARINLFGPFSVEINGQQVRQWRGGRAKNLFQYLIVNRNKLVLKERLYEVLWPHAEWSPQSSSLKVAVHALRQVLNAQPACGGHRLEVLYQDFGYVLKVEGDVWIDVSEFDELARAARIAEARNDTARAAATYQRAIALYRGDFLVGESAGWVDEQREWLRGSALRALRYLAGSALQRGDEERALQYCRLTLEIEGCCEEAYRTVIAIYARRRERGQVQRWYSLCANRLHTQLGVRPSAETERLVRAALAVAGQAGAGEPRPAARR